MFKEITKHKMFFPVFLIFLILSSNLAYADDTLFSTNLYAKFQVKACTTCHDFHDEAKNGFYYNNHAKRRDINRCVKCHSEKITGFAHSAEWFALPGLYTSGMDAVETCKKTKEALHYEFKSDTLLASQLEKHLLEDPRVLWGIKGATPESGNLPYNKKETDLVMGGMEEWKYQVMAWIKGGMNCE